MAGGMWGGGYIYITVGGLQTMDLKIRALQTFGERITSLQEPLTQIGEDLLGDFAQNMATEGGLFTGGPFGGGGWAPLAPSTIKDRERKGYGAGPILWRTGRLGQSLAQRGSADNIFEVTADTLRVGTRVPYAQYHQRGAGRKTIVKSLMVEVPRHRRFAVGQTLPRRTLVDITRFRQTMIVRRISDWVREQVRLSGVA